MTRSAAFTACLLAAFAGAIGVPAPADDHRPGSVPEIVQRSIAFHGGEKFTSSDISFRTCSKSGCSDVRAHVDGGSFALEAATVRDGVERRVRVTNDTTELWVGGEHQEIPADEVQRNRDWVMQRVYFNFLPYRLEDPSVRHQDLGLVDWRGEQLHKVKVTFEPGTSTDADDEYMYWFDAETGRLVQFAYSYGGDPGGLRFRRLFNFRSVDGLVFYDQQNLGIAGDDLTVDEIDADFVDHSLRRVSTIEVREIEVDPID